MAFQSVSEADADVVILLSSVVVAFFVLFPYLTGMETATPSDPYVRWPLVALSLVILASLARLAWRRR